MSTINRTGLVDINDNDNGQELILIIISTSAFLFLVCFLCGTMIYYCFSSKTQTKKLRRVDADCRRQIKRRISNVLKSTNTIREQSDESSPYNT